MTTGIILLLTVALLGVCLFRASYDIRRGVYLKALCKKETVERVVFLTFDDGPDERYTPLTLDVLKRYRATATFFCIGKRAEEHPALVRRIVSGGHTVGNHSYSHSNAFPLFSLKKMLADMKRSEECLERITGERTGLFRPPFGVTNPVVAKAVRLSGYTVIGWSVRSLDTRGEAPGKIFRRIVKQLSPGDVILLHDRMPGCPELLVLLLDYLDEQGYKVTGIDKLVQS
ncbi:MAG: polysaccharide deacetylase family protein [Tannerellaceae bacterium]|jgi:peptidoglycan/xylan/chitin deacetylase (PgdA/CDA1 family)|nr:polysaccharide deacetylase family protein [Tannerellaceae bacterium]